MAKGTRKGNRIEVNGDVATIHLTKGGTTKVDAADIPRIRTMTWRLAHGYPATSQMTPKGTYRLLTLSRFLLGGSAGCGKAWVADHIDGNPLNNTRANLRVLSNRANVIAGRSSMKKVTKTSAFPGVYFEKYTGMWKAQAHIGEVNVNLGRFTDEQAAYRRYVDACASIETGIHPKTGEHLSGTLSTR